MIRFGVADYGVNVWDGGLYDMATRLEDIKAAGLEGIERLEAATEAEAMQKAALFRRYGMDFATCRGPNPALGILWTAALGKDYVWLTPGPVGRDVEMDTYCRRTNKMLDACRKAGIKGVLHNHLGQRIQNQDELDHFMVACPDAKLLLDAGHLFAAGGDVPGTIRKYANRIEAVHVKDIVIKDANKSLEEWGARLRFCELGGGNAGFPMEAIAKALCEIHYSGWIFIEHDTHTDDAVKQLKISRQVLKDLFGF